MTIDKESQSRISEYLSRKLSEGQLILFTGAGFSMSAKDHQDESLPSGRVLAKELWQLAFPDQEFDDSSLSDVYEAARKSGERKLTEYLTKRFTVNPKTLPSWYKTAIGQPWYKAYTLNIDNLMNTAASKFNLSRKLVSLSKDDPVVNLNIPKDLVVRHLNGSLSDLPDGVVFTDQHYGLRLSSAPDSIYMQLTAELLKHPFVFIGSELDESLLWQHIALRRSKGKNRSYRETRPNSLLVIPELSKARQKMLSGFNIDWIPMTGEEFTSKYLGVNESASFTGIANLKRQFQEGQQQSQSIPTVSSLIQLEEEKLAKKTDYLMGATPRWFDVASGVAITRDKEDDWCNEVRKTFSQKNESSPLFIFTGTAGDGKTTFAMKIASKLSAEGKIIAWLNEDHNIPPQKLIHLINKIPGVEGLIIDNPDIYGRSIIEPLAELCRDNILKFVAVVIRSGEIDNFLSHPQLCDLKKIEKRTYNLRDNEINLLIDKLKETNLLGFLKGKNREEQFKIFKNKAQSQLIVAMIEATSGKDFTEKINDEFETLDSNSKEIYCLVALATSIGHYLTSKDILLTINDPSNKSANKINNFKERGLFQINEFNGLRVRHKLIAEKVSSRLIDDGQILNFYAKLSTIAAVSLLTVSSSDSRMKRLLRYTLNHRRLLSIGNYQQAQDLYSSLENIQCNSYHYWLQRGSLELETGNLSLAQNYLEQAKALNDQDPYVELAYASLAFKLVNDNPESPESEKRMSEAFETLEELIKTRGEIDAYPYHVLGNEGLHWSRRSHQSVEKKKVFLTKLHNLVKQGVNFHRNDKMLIKLDRNLQREILNLAVVV